MKLLDTAPHLFNKIEADKIVGELNNPDDDWSYEVDCDPKGIGYSRIKVYDEHGDFVGFL